MTLVRSKYPYRDGIREPFGNSKMAGVFLHILQAATLMLTVGPCSAPISPTPSKPRDWGPFCRSERQSPFPDTARARCTATTLPFLPLASALRVRTMAYSERALIPIFKFGTRYLLYYFLFT